jgi:gamma-glutamyltranspeptidase/glutathione hydrolase
MTPTFVLRPDGSLWFALGSPGGPTIINTVLQVMTNVIDHGMDVQQAVDAPRLHHQWLPDEIVSSRLACPKTRNAPCRARSSVHDKASLHGRRAGHHDRGENGVRLGASDARGEGAAMGY